MSPKLPLLAAAGLAALAAAALAAATFAPAALADCQTSVTVTLVGNNWGPLPLWRITDASGNNWDVNSDTAADALAMVINSVCPSAPGLAPDPSPPETTTTVDASTPGPAAVSQDATDEAQALIDAAEVTLLGTEWGPVPIWAVYLPSRAATYDVAASDEAAARAAVLAFVARDVQDMPNVTPALEGPTLAASQADPVQVAPTVAVVLAPPKAKTAKHGTHSHPATAKKF